MYINNFNISYKNDVIEMSTIKISIKNIHIYLIGKYTRAHI